MKRNALFAFVAALSFAASAHAITYDVTIAFDTDRNTATGCTLTTPAGTFAGAEQLVVTHVNVVGSVATTTGVTRQACGGGVFGGAVPVDTHSWPAGLTTSGNLFIETHVTPTELGATAMSPMRVGFFVTNGTLSDAATTNHGAVVLLPDGLRHRAVVPATARAITLDGNDSDWHGISPITDGGAGSPDLRILNAYALLQSSDIFFGIRLQANHNAPTAHDDVYALPTVGGTLSVPAASGVLANDNDPNSLPLTAILVAGVQHGTLTLNGNGSFDYTHDGSLAQLDTFEYKDSNGTLESNTAQVQIGIGAGGGPNPPPTPAFTSADHATFTAGTFGTFTVITSPAHPTASITATGTLPTGVTFQDNGDGTATISGTPSPGTGGVYHLGLKATNVVGSATQDFSLTVIETSTLPAITQQPLSQTVCNGSTATFTAAASGTPAPTVQWQVSTNGGGSFNNILGATSTTLTFIANSSQNANQYRAVFTNVLGTATTNAAILTVTVPPVVTTHPLSQTLCAGSSVTFTAASTPAAPVQWQVSTGGPFSDIPGATSTTLTFVTTTADNGKQYHAVFTNACGTATSNNATLTVNANPATPAITPTPAQVCANSTGNTAAGPAGATTYAWSIVNGSITSAANIQTITYTAGASGTVGLTLVVTNGAGCSASNTANVTINANPATPTITPTPAQVCANSTSNSAAGPAGATTYAWSIVNGSITSATNIQTITYTAGASGTVGLTLVVTNGAGCSASNTVNVTINANPATPTITPTPAAVCANSTGNSAAGPAGATTYAWSIVNGIITSATNIQTITYTAGASGTVDLTLVVTNAAGCSASNTANVTINPTPATPTITPNPAQVCANSTGNTADGPAGATTYAWSIVNGTITSATNIQTITYTAGASGTVDLTLVVTNGAGCSASNTVNVTINANPSTPTITPNPPTVCANSTGNMADGPAGATTYAWSIVNGSITSAANIQTITYTAGASGTVDLTLVVTNAAGCSATNTVNVTINANPATPTITPTPAQVCANSTGNSADGPAGATTYAWSIVNGTITSATNIQTITYTAGASGTVDLTLVVTNAAGCSASNTVNVTINPSPATPTITPTPAQVCANSTGNSAAGPAGATTYAWSIVNGSITSAANIQTITYTAGASGTVDLTLVVTNASGCSATNTVNVTINANPATPTITPTPAQVCANSTGNSADGPAGATTYAWSIVNGSITSAANIQTITYTAGASGTVDLTLVVTNAAGCSASNTVNVTINANPSTPTITPTPAQVCANSTGNSAAGPAGATTYAWSIVNGTITSATNIQTITYDAGASGTVDLTLVVTNAAGCSASNTVNVTINANPATPTITPTPAQVCANSTGNSAAGPAGATTYAWSIVNGTITSAANIQTITYTAGASGTVDLTLVVTNAAGCSASNTVNVTINANPATPTITPTPAQVCANSTGNTADGPAGATTYAWSIVNGAITSATNIQTITYTAGASGTVDLTLVVTNAAGCSASNTVNVTINATPTTPTITPTPATLCPNSTGNTADGPAGATTYAWSIVNGTITSATNIQTITYTAGASGTVDLTLVVTNGFGCSAGNTINVPISNTAPVVTTDPLSQSVQSGSSVTFTAAASGSPAPTVQWQVSNGGPFTDIGGATSTSLTFTAQISQNGNQYRAVFTNACGSATTAAATLTVTCPTITVTRTAGGSFPAGTFNTAYTGESVSASGGTGPYTFAVTAGALPTNLSLATNGAISGTPSATGTFNFTVTATDANGCQGLQAFSIAIKPAASGDTYNNLVNNTQAVVTGGTTASPATPFVSLTGFVTANDLPSGGVALVAGTFATTQGGSVTTAADGSFIYTPPVTGAALASDTFNYTITSDTGGTGTPASANGTVTLNLVNRVWYVKNNGAAGNGQSQSPFNTLVAAQTASTASDIIFVYNGDGTTTGQNAGITLKANQQLIGEGVALVVNGNTLVVAGTKPQITNTAATSDVVTLNDGNTVKGVTITGTAGARDGISSVIAHAGFTADTITVQNNVNVGVNLISMTGTVTITNSTISTVGNQALTINNGTAAVTVDNTNTVNGGTGTAVSVLNRPAAAGAIAIGATITGGQIQLLSNLSGTISFTGSQTLSNTTVNGITMTTNAGATINFSGTLNVTTTTGVPFQASGGGTLNVTGTANLTSGAASSALSLNGMTVGGSGVTFTSVSGTGPTTGIALTNMVSGTVTVNGGNITNAGTGVSLQGLNSNLSLAGVTIGGTTTTGITNTTNFGTLTIGAGVNVSAVTALNLTTGTVTGTFANVSSSGGTNGVNLISVSGTWGTTAGTLTGATGSTFNLSGAAAAGSTINWGGAITQANAANVVTISGGHNRTANFTGNVQTSGTSTGINISASSGTYSFSGTTNTIAGSGGGVTIVNESGSITFGSGTSITAATTSFKIGGTATNTTANITYSGTITNNVNGGTLLDINSASGTYSTGTITFNGTSLSGNVAGNNGVISRISNMTGTLVVNNLSLTSSNNTFNNTLLLIAGTNTAGSFTFTNLTLSATGNNHTGKGLVMSGGGTLNVTGANSINVGSSALDLNGIALGASTIGTVTSLGVAGANGVLFTTVTGGTLTIGGGTITGNTASAFKVSGGSATINSSAAVTQSLAARVIDVSGITGGTLTFAGAITGSGTCTGITLGGTSGTVTITGGMTLNGAADTFSSTTAGLTINVTGTNTIGATTPPTGPAVNIASATIGGSNVTFRSVSATGGTNGIIINNVGAGTFNVTGNAGTCTSLGSTCTGGTIQNTTSHAVSLNSTTSPSLNFMKITNIGTSGVFGTNVTNFTLATSVIDGVNTSHTGADANVAFNTGVAGTETNVSGTVSITNNTLNNSYQAGIDIQNYNGTISSLTITNNSMTSNTSNTLSLGTAINVVANRGGANHANISAGTISSNSITNFPAGAGIQVIGGNSNAGQAVTIASTGSPFLINGNTITGSGPAGAGMGTNGIAVTAGQSTSAFFQIGASGAANNITNVRGNGIACSLFGNGTEKCIIQFNVLVTNNTAGSAGINTGADQSVASGSAGVGTLYLDIHNNNVSGNTGNGILSTVRSVSSSGIFHIENNTVAAPTQVSATTYGIRVDSGNGTGSPTVCLKINGNTTAGSTSGANTAPGIGIRQSHVDPGGGIGTFQIQGLAPSPSNDTQMATYVGNTGQNPGSANGTFGTTGVASISAGGTFTANTCTIP